MQTKFNLLQKVRATCTNTDNYQPKSRFIAVDESFRNSSFHKWLFHGCTMDRYRRDRLKAYDQRANAGTFDLVTRDQLESECPEIMYRQEYPEVDQQVQLGRLKSGKEHYLQKGYNSTSINFFCPERCINSGDVKACVTCDKNATYLKTSPDVENATRNGHFVSGREQYELKGCAEGPVYSCFERYQEPGRGTPAGCKDTFTRFINATKTVVKTWPVVGQNTTASSSACKALVMMEGRNHPWMDYTLRVHRRFTGPDWMFYLIGPPHVAEEWRRKYAGPMVTIIDLPPKFGNLSVYPTQYNDLSRSEFLWRDVVQCEHVLVTQRDALLLRHGIEDFFEFAYVGSQVYPESFPATDWRCLCTANERCGGNGGLSLRRRSESLHAIAQCRIPRGLYDDDLWFSACFAELGLTQSLPHPVIANRFSTGSKCLADSQFGMYKLWQNCKESTCVNILMNSQLYKDIYGEKDSEYKCREGELLYHLENRDFTRAGFTSGWEHYQKFGRHEESRRWKCFEQLERPREELQPFNLPDNYEDHNQKSLWVHW